MTMFLIKFITGIIQDTTHILSDIKLYLHFVFTTSFENINRRCIAIKTTTKGYYILRFLCCHSADYRIGSWYDVKQ